MDAREERLNVLVMAPMLDRDLSWVSAVDERITVLDGNDAFVAEQRGPRVARGDELLAQAEVLLVGFPVPRDLASRAPRLRWAHHSQAGVSNLWESDLWTSDVMLTSSRGSVSPTAIAEYVVAAVFHFARGLHEGSRQKADGAFTRDGYEMRAVAGSTLGIIGLGGIGREVARIGRAVGMRVIATRRSVATAREDVDVDRLLPPDQLLEVAAQSDFLAVCSQLTAETRDMIDAEVFAVMKPTAVLVNIARGEEVDELALVDALQRGEIAGAVLDVHRDEFRRAPIPELLQLPQVLITPHISGGGQVTPRTLEPIFVQNLRRFLDGLPMLNVVDRERGY
ncbi:MAG: D-2-hydroxyacid dehydrogenase [Acidimicrobiia bacterium]